MMSDIMEFLTLMFVGMFVILSILVGLASVGNYYACIGYGEATGKATKYVNLVCYIELDGQWYSSREYRKIVVPHCPQVEEK